MACLIYTYIYIHTYTFLHIAFWQSSAPGPLSTLVTSVLLYLLTQATLMSPGKDETRVCGYIRSEFIHWAFWRTLMRTEYFLFVHHATSVLAKFSTCSFEHSGDISSSLLVNPSHTDESWEGRNMCLWIYIYIHIYIYIYIYIICYSLLMHKVFTFLIYITKLTEKPTDFHQADFC